MGERASQRTAFVWRHDLFCLRTQVILTFDKRYLIGYSSSCGKLTPENLRLVIMSLIFQIRAAKESGLLVEPFTTEDVTKWVAENRITKNNGEPYAKSSIKAILSNSDMANVPTSNKNTKLLNSTVNFNRKYYYFI